MTHKLLFDPTERLVAATAIDEQPALSPGDIVHIPVRVADVTPYPIQDHEQCERTFWLVGFTLAGQPLIVNGYNVHTEIDVAKETSND